MALTATEELINQARSEVNKYILGLGLDLIVLGGSEQEKLSQFRQGRARTAVVVKDHLENYRPMNTQPALAVYDDFKEETRLDRKPPKGAVACLVGDSRMKVRTHERFEIDEVIFPVVFYEKR